jgi:hypothetical protein
MKSWTFENDAKTKVTVKAERLQEAYNKASKFIYNPVLISVKELNDLSNTDNESDKK